MREEVRAARDRLVAALEAHAEAAVAVARPDIPDPLPQANEELVAAVTAYRETVEHFTGAYVPVRVARPAPEDATDGAPSDDGGEQDTVPPLDDDIDWAGDAERWR